MRRPNVLIVTLHFPPSAASGAFRLAGFAKHLPAHGWDVTVVAPRSTPWEPVDRAAQLTWPDETKVVYTEYPFGKFAARLQGLFERSRLIDATAAWWPRAWAACKCAIQQRKPDVLLTSGPPHSVHLLGLALKRRFRLKWAADFRDPWIATNYSAPSGWQRTWLSNLEKCVVADADALVVNAPRARDRLAEVFPHHQEKMVTVTNGFDPGVFDFVHNTGRQNGPLTIVHCGELYHGRDPRPLLRAAKSYRETLHENGCPMLRFVGRYSEDLQLEKAIADCGLAGNVTLAGQLSHAATIREMAAADILLLLDTPGRSIGVPAKLYEYLGAGKPILALAEPDSDVGWVLARSQRPYQIARPGDTAGIYQAIATLVDDVQNQDCAGNCNDSIFTRHATTGILSQNMESLMGISPQGSPNSAAQRQHALVEA